jgi:hypothetical protein
MKRELSNQIIIMTISSLMPVRFMRDLSELKRHYEGLRADKSEACLQHGEGDGRGLPSLFARTAAETAALQRRKPMMYVARLLDMLSQRENRTTGRSEWIYMRFEGGLPRPIVLQGKSWDEVVVNGLEDAAQTELEREVASRMANDFKHVDRKREVLGQFEQLAREVLEANGRDDQAPDYLAISDLRPAVRKILGLADGE